jgi:Uma2 family endonuclease
MAAVPLRQPPRLSVAVFRQFVEGRPDEEHWELIDGIAMMMTPPTFAHQRIASNLERLLLDAFERNALPLTAYQAIGVNLSPPAEDYDPEPDVVVVDSSTADMPGERYATRFYLAAEIVSPSDRPIIESKRAIYQLHEACKCILTVQQERCEVRLDLRGPSGWTELLLSGPEQQLVLTDFGLTCKVADLYRGTPLQPRGSRSKGG